MSGVSGYEDYCGNRAALECPYSSCDGCPVKDAAKPKVDALKAENALLRELARHLYACLSYCDRNDERRGCGYCPYRSVGEDCEFEQRLLELGVEVEA